VSIPTAEDFQAELDRILHAAKEEGEPSIDVKSGDLHRRVGGYPAHNHRMPLCCQVMKRNMKGGAPSFSLRQAVKGQH
jgi:5-methylcytosine-specific restriction protein A